MEEQSDSKSKPLTTRVEESRVSRKKGSRKNFRVVTLLASYLKMAFSAGKEDWNSMVKQLSAWDYM